MFIIADKYDLPRLSQLAEDKFQMTAGDHEWVFNQEDFKVFSKVYLDVLWIENDFAELLSHTLQSGMDAILSKGGSPFRGYRHRDDNWWTLISKSPDFLLDVLRAAAEEREADKSRIASLKRALEEA